MNRISCIIASHFDFRELLLLVTDNRKWNINSDVKWVLPLIAGHCQRGNINDDDNGTVRFTPRHIKRKCPLFDKHWHFVLDRLVIINMVSDGSNCIRTYIIVRQRGVNSQLISSEHGKHGSKIITLQIRRGLLRPTTIYQRRFFLFIESSSGFKLIAKR